jgi:membrane fusion protein (multidrug efflux system)
MPVEAHSSERNILASQFSATTRSLANDGFRYASLTWLCAGLMLAAWLCWFLLSEVTIYETSTRARLEVRQAPHAVAAPVSGKVVSAPLAIGQEVRAGAVLVVLDAGSEQLRLQEERARVAAMAPRIASMKKEIAALGIALANDRGAAAAAAGAARYRSGEARASLEFAEENARRLQQESDAGSMPQIDALRARSEAARLAATGSALSADARRLELESAYRAQQGQAQVESLNRSVAALEAERAAGELAVQRLQAEVERHTVRAPVAGRIGDFPAALRPGSYANAGDKLAVVVPAGDLVILADFPPAAVLGRVRPGQAARLRLTGFPWTQYGSIDATVSRVASEVRDNLVRVELAPRGAAESRLLMQHGLPGSVEVTVERLAPALMMLRASGQLLSQPEAQPHVQPVPPEAGRG